VLIGYARTSTVDQRAGFEAQKATLLAQGCTKLFSEQTSSVGERAQLDLALELARESDALIVTKLDRLARSVSHFCEIVRLLESKGVSLVILDMGLDTSKPTGRLMINLLASIGQFETEVMLERQRVGIAKAKTEGKYLGRKPTALLKAKEAIRRAIADSKPLAGAALALPFIAFEHTQAAVSSRAAINGSIVGQVVGSCGRRL
jgi:DNA invertase Pin-like site-specific DNA recombinase